MILKQIKLNVKQGIIFIFILTIYSFNVPQGNKIYLTYGKKQQFRYRHADINILGSFEGSAKKATYRLNNGDCISFFIKGMNPTVDKISRNRLFRKGDFNIEIPMNSEGLAHGENTVRICIIDSSEYRHFSTICFTWDTTPVPLPLKLTDLSKYNNIQQIGQVVNGRFELDTTKNVIRSSVPVASDALLLLGSPHGSQEACYSVRFGGTKGVFIGLADFFAGHEAAVPDVGIKPGWSSAGLATLRPGDGGLAQSWLAWGDLLNDERKWVVKTDPPKPFSFEVGIEYKVRQQVIFKNGINTARFKIWLATKEEPDNWLCEESDEHIPAHFTKHRKGSFGLFQFHGIPTEWFDIEVVALR